MSTERVSEAEVDASALTLLLASWADLCLSRLEKRPKTAMVGNEKQERTRLERG